MVQKIEDKAKENGWTVAREQLFETDNQPLRPDLVIKTPGKAWVVDVTVRFEKSDLLREAHREKINKYAAVLASVKRAMGVDQAKVLPVVIGARGGETRRNLSVLGMADKKRLEDLILDVVRSSIYIGRSHLDLG